MKIVSKGLAGLAFAFLAFIAATGPSAVGETSHTEQPVPSPSGASQSQALAAYGKLPLSFERNLGQTDPRVKFLSRGQGFTLFLTETEAVFQSPNRRSSIVDRTSNVLRMKFVGAHSSSRLSGFSDLPGKIDYFIGSDRKQWRSNIPHYSRVRQKGVYRGIDLIYYGNQRQLEYDFVVNPGADPNVIRLAFSGEDRIELDSRGDVVLRVGGGEIHLRKPAVYQEINGKREAVPGRYPLFAGKSGGSKQTHPLVGFEIGAYDRTRPLVIDPVVYSTYLGGSGADNGAAIAGDVAENAYVTGWTLSTNFPTVNPIQQSFGGGTIANDVFVTKLNPAGNAAVYSTYLGGAVANLGATRGSLTFTAFDKAGTLISGTNITNPKLLDLKAGEQLPIVDSQVFGSGIAARKPLGWFKVESTFNKLVGFFLTFNTTLSFLDGADVSSSTLTTFVLPEIEDQGFTQIHIANPSAEAAAITLELIDSAGIMRVSASRTVNPNGAVAELFGDLFPGVDGRGSAYIRVSSNKGVVPFEFLGKTGIYVEGLSGQDTSTGATTLYSPQYVVGGPDWRSTLSVVNLDSTPGEVTFEFIKDDGTLIGTRQAAITPRGKVFVTEQDFFVNGGDILSQGYVKITSNGPKLAGSVVFGDPARSIFSSALPLVSILRSTIVFSQVASNTTYFTGLALLNPGDANASAVIEIFDKQGSLVISKTEEIQAKRRKSQLLTQYFPILEGSNLSSGYIRITANQNVAGFALFGTNVLSVLSAVPPQIVPP